MSNSILFHSLNIHGFEHIKWDWKGKKTATQFIIKKRKLFKCPTCNSKNVTATYIYDRQIRASKIGKDHWVLNIKMHRIRCHEEDCRAFRMEELPFLSHQKARITNEFERTILELRPEMSISALAKFYDLDWRTIKEIEKKHLKKKYKSIKLKNVKIIGMDEIYVGKNNYKTIVRDLETGAVLHVGNGKGGKALANFLKRLKTSKAKIEVIAMDMSSGYSAWARNNLEDSQIVFDHFHVIKLMNDKIEKIRRRTVKELEEKDLVILKKKIPSLKK